MQPSRKPGGFGPSRPPRIRRETTLFPDLPGRPNATIRSPLTPCLDPQIGLGMAPSGAKVLNYRTICCDRRNGHEATKPVVAGHPFRSLRLSVRTPPFHGGESGSIPLGSAKNFAHGGRRICLHAAQKHHSRNSEIVRLQIRCASCGTGSPCSNWRRLGVNRQVGSRGAAGQSQQRQACQEYRFHFRRDRRSAVIAEL